MAEETVILEDDEADAVLARVGVKRKSAVTAEKRQKLEAELESVSGELLPLYNESTKNADKIARLNKKCDDLRQQIADIE
jgi:peptidoglycan hydrolase CwlO-like protein